MRVRSKSRQVRLTEIAKAGAGSKPAKPVQCRVCLADEVLTQHGNQWRSSLRNGVCKDRSACENRQPPLIPMEEL